MDRSWPRYLKGKTIVTKKHVETNPDDPPTLSSLIEKYATEDLPRRSDEKTKRDFDYSDVELSKLLVTLMPEGKPHKVAEARSLTEIFYHQQTLPLPKLLLRAHKSLTTDAFETSLVEGKVSVLYNRIEELKRRHSWSMRQPKKFIDPFLKSNNYKKTHWDSLLSEAKWLSTDMKEERRFKLYQCYEIAQAISDYWTYDCCQD
ncbi:unnamed protein product [Ambrosiozyma monospora]|uniref:Unnamed protein product n=1 Tax=Ambrosiozyma monospora TaxID=43982 RepID=A0ACB5TTV8_AMBMO|nr:unnamed protein product [Ambrosiozyma monospora]